MADDAEDDVVQKILRKARKGTRRELHPGHAMLKLEFAELALRRSARGQPSASVHLAPRRQDYRVVLHGVFEAWSSTPSWLASSATSAYLIGVAQAYVCSTTPGSALLVLSAYLNWTNVKKAVEIPITLVAAPSRGLSAQLLRRALCAVGMREATRW